MLNLALLNSGAAACSQKLFARLGRFWRSEDGVSTVEWVALASGLVIGAIVVSFIIMSGLTAPATNITKQLSP
jgi:Flp pilus assembly protein TadG